MEICQTSDCDNSPIAICLHCQEHLCVEHLLQHNEALINQANIYCDEFNQLNEHIEKMSFNEQFTTAEEDLNDWLNDQMKQLDKIYEDKLFQLKQFRSQVDEKLNKFKQTQQMKMTGIQRQLFTSQLNKQISSEQLNRMKIAVEQLREDIHQFNSNQCSITLVNNDQMNYSYKPNIDIQFTKKISLEDQECNKSKQSQLRADAKPFEYIPKEQHWNSPSSIRQLKFSGRLFDGCSSVGSMDKIM